MRAIHGWAHMMGQSLTVAPLTSRDGYGKPTYGTAVTYRCRLVGKRTRVINAIGQEVVSNWTAYLDTNVAIEPDSLVTLSTGDVGSTESYAITPPILSVRRLSSDAGWHHTQLFL